MPLYRDPEAEQWRADGVLAAPAAEHKNGFTLIATTQQPPPPSGLRKKTHDDVRRAACTSPLSTLMSTYREMHDDEVETVQWRWSSKQRDVPTGGI